MTRVCDYDIEQVYKEMIEHYRKVDDLPSPVLYSREATPRRLSSASLAIFNASKPVDEQLRNSRPQATRTRNPSTK